MEYKKHHNSVSPGSWISLDDIELEIAEEFKADAYRQLYYNQIPKEENMKIKWDIPYSFQRQGIKDVAWPQDWPLPVLGAPVFLRDSSVMLIVDSVEYYPEGNFDLAPHVEVTLKEPRTRPTYSAGMQFGEGNVQVNTFL